MRSLVRWCLDRTSVVILGTIVILLAGIFGATQLRQQLFPDMDFPFLIATVPAPGLDAGTVDRDVAAPMARAAAALPGARRKNITTVAREGNARLYAQLEFGTDTEESQDALRRELERAGLPEQAGPVEFMGGFADQAVLTASLVAPKDMSIGELSSKAVEWKKDLENVKGVGKVEISGGSIPRIEIELKPTAIAAGATPTAVAEAVKGAQTNQTAGLTSDKGTRVPIVVAGPGLTSKEEVGRVRVNGAPLASIASIRTTGGGDDGFARANGRSALALSIFRSPDANEVEVVDSADEVLDDVRKDIGKANVVTIYENASEVRASIKGLLIEAGLGALFAVFVIFLFLRSGTATLVAAVSIPTSLVFGMLAAWALGLTLNIITLAGLTIAIGRVIDDSIVVLENAYRHLERGERRRQAVLNGTSEVGRAIAASTLATAAVFLPLGLVSGFIAEIFFSFSIIVACALLASLLVAVTIVPVLCNLFLPKQISHADGRTGSDEDSDEEKIEEGRLTTWVTPATRFGLRHRWITLGSAVAVFAAAIVLVGAGTVPVQFLPDTGAPQLFGTVSLPPGTDPEKAERLLKPLDKLIRDQKGLKDYQVGFGGAALDFGDPAQSLAAATFFFSVDEDVDAQKLVTSIRKEGSELYPNGAFKVRQVENGPPSGSFQATVEAEKREDLIKATGAIVAMIEKRKDAVEVGTDAADLQPQVTVSVRPGVAVPPAAVTGTIAALGATVPAGEVDGTTPIVVRAPSSLLANADALKRVPLATGAAFGGPGTATSMPAGAPTELSAAPLPSARADAAPPVTLGDVASVRRENTPALVVRNADGNYTALVTAKLLGEDTRTSITEIQDGIAKLDKQGKLGKASVIYEGDAEFINDMFKDLGIAMLTAIVLVYLILVLVFGSLGQPLTILAPVMFSLIGSLLALVVTGRALGLPAMIGQLLLIGIVVANSILLVDTALHLRRRGMRRDASLMQAARLRVRPVLMTATATIAALMPLSIGVSGEGGIISKSLGTVVIGGLITATVLTLVIVPAVFTFFDRDRPMRRQGGRGRGRGRGAGGRGRGGHGGGNRGGGGGGGGNRGGGGGNGGGRRGGGNRGGGRQGQRDRVGGR